MKKVIIVGGIFLIVGLLLGNKLSTAKNSITDVFSEGKTYYFLQEGVYTSKEIMEENTKNMNIKAVDFKNSKYYVYVGITKEEKIAKKIKKLYEEEGYQIYIKEVRLSNEEFDSNVTQFDLLINSTNSKDEILTITEVVLANYEEIIKKQ